MDMTQYGMENNGLLIEQNHDFSRVGLGSLAQEEFGQMFKAIILSYNIIGWYRSKATTSLGTVEKKLLKTCINSDHFRNTNQVAREEKINK